MHQERATRADDDVVDVALEPGTFRSCRMVYVGGSLAQLRRHRPLVGRHDVEPRRLGEQPLGVSPAVDWPAPARCRLRCHLRSSIDSVSSARYGVSS